MKACGGVDVYIHIFLTSALVGGEWSGSRPGRFTPWKRAPGTYWIGGWVDPTAGLDDMEKRKFLTLSGLELRPSVVQLVASRYTDWAVSARMYMKRLFILQVTQYTYNIRIMGSSILFRELNGVHNVNDVHRILVRKHLENRPRGRVRSRRKVT
jgi:hypothetical protein